MLQDKVCKVLLAGLSVHMAHTSALLHICIVAAQQKAICGSLLCMKQDSSFVNNNQTDLLVGSHLTLTALLK